MEKKSSQKINTYIKNKKKKKENYSKTFNEIRHYIKIETATTAKFEIIYGWHRY